VSRHRIRAFLAKLEMDGVVRPMCADLAVSSAAGRADRNDCKGSDWTSSASNF